MTRNPLPLDQVDACPNCDSTMIYSRMTEPRHKKWRCRDCEYEFGSPNRRDPKKPVPRWAQTDG